MKISSMIITIIICVGVVVTYKLWKPYLDRGLIALKERFGPKA